MILQCKMCGGDIEVNENMTVGVCSYCGSTMTLPKIDSDKKVRLFNMANQYRLNCEFDKSYKAYQNIIDEDETEAEAYWGLILSEYGVEYVEDPKSKKRVPTCHRTQIHSVQSTVNYEMACKYASIENRMMYEDEAEKIDAIQKSILAISSKEDPYDVFICYKESDTFSGERTQDSLIAHDIYNELTREGFNVFYSRITLEDKLGHDYEPYIFSALKSSKVMLVVTTSFDNVNSVWVKNEWSRYLNFMQEDRNKTIIPVYRDINVYELPDALKKYQSQDMNKIGAMQDLVHAVKKLNNIESVEKKNSALDELLKDKYEREVAEAVKKKKISKAKKITKGITAVVIAALMVFATINYGIPFAKYVYSYIRYNNAIECINENKYEEAIAILSELNGFKESEGKIYEAQIGIAVQMMADGQFEDAFAKINSITNLPYNKCVGEEGNYYLAKYYLYEQKNYLMATTSLDRCINYKDSANIYLDMQFMKLQDAGITEDNIEELRMISNGQALLKIKSDMNIDGIVHEAAKQELEKLCSGVYKEAITAKNNGDWDTAVDKFTVLGDYKDSKSQLDECNNKKGESDYNTAINAMNNGNWNTAIEKFTALGDYKDSKSQLENCKKSQLEAYVASEYNKGIDAYNATKWQSAINYFRNVLNNNSGYKDAKQLLANCENNIAAEKARFEGTWYEADNFWTNIKIENGKVYTASQTDTKRNKWDAEETSYDVDNGVLVFSIFTGDKYSVSVSGNTLRLTWLNPQDQWDTDWFGSHNVFYRQ